jgi:phosphinothricin acetyltransferase
MSPSIGPMTSADWKQLREIYLQGIATGNATFETSVPSWEEWDQAHLPFCRLMARSGEQVIGWAALLPVSSRAVYCGVAEASLYVHENFRGRGIGRELLAALIRDSETQGIWTLQASVFAENGASRALLQQAGFREVGRRERIGRLHGVWRDTILLERRSLTVGAE